MSARDKLYEMVLQPIEEYSCDLGPDGEAAEANRLIDAFAHELAEQIRSEVAGAVGVSEYFDGMNDAADLIDPNTNKEN